MNLSQWLWMLGFVATVPLLVSLFWAADWGTGLTGRIIKLGLYIFMAGCCLATGSEINTKLIGKLSWTAHNAMVLLLGAIAFVVMCTFIDVYDWFMWKIGAPLGFHPRLSSKP